MRGTRARVMPCAAGLPVRVAGVCNGPKGQLCARALAWRHAVRRALWRVFMAWRRLARVRAARVRLAGFATLWRVARVRVAHGIAGGIVRRLAGFQRVAGHCGAARGGFIVAAAGAWKTRKPLIYNGFSAFRGAWRGAVFP